jgi:glycosyltransferase involved in cell wall biosynthesis
MINKNLSKLVIYDKSKFGWPWGIDDNKMPEESSKYYKWPKISVITPSYNQGKFIELTIRSVLLQGYPNLEYIIIDGGSSDETIEVIKKYEQHITYWVSEKDSGQTNAINKGFDKATGEILCWLNSDDIFAPDALKTVAEKMKERDVLWLAGGATQIEIDGSLTIIYDPEKQIDFSRWVWKMARGQSYIMPQPSVFWSRKVWQECGPLDESLNYVFDHDFFIRITHKFGAPLVLGNTLSYFLFHERSKSGIDQSSNVSVFPFCEERLKTALKNSIYLSMLHRLLIWFTTKQTSARFYFLSSKKKLNKHANKIVFVFDCLIKHPIIIFDRMYLGFIRKRLLSSDKI